MIAYRLLQPQQLPECYDEPGAGRCFLLGTASLSAVGYEHGWSEPVIRLWNETPHGGRINPAQVRGHGEEARR